MEASAVTDYLEQPDRFLTPRQKRWLRPLSPSRSAVRRFCIAANRRLVRLLFRLRVTGAENLPLQSPTLITPNHTSSLDGAVLFAALDDKTLADARWAGRSGAVMRHAVRRYLNRLAKTVPIERNSKALAAAAAVIKRGESLVWFPEGTRTRDGELQQLKPGAGLLMRHFDVPVVPIWLEGAYHALTPGTLRLRLFSPIEVRIGRPFTAGELELDGLDEEDQVDRCVAELRRRMIELRDDRPAPDDHQAV